MRLKVMVGVLAFSASASAEVPVTFEKIKGLLESGSARVQAAGLEAAAAREREGYLLRSFLPSLEARGAQENFKVGQRDSRQQPMYLLEARLNLFNGGRDALENDIRTLESQKREFQSRRVSAEELEKVRSLYWRILYLREKAKLLKAALEINDKNLAAAQRRIKSGVAADSDRFEFEMRAVDLKREQSRLGVEFDNEVRMMGVLLGSTDTLSFPESLAHDHEYEKILKNSESDVEFLSKEFEVQGLQAELRARSESRSWWPRVEAFAAYAQHNEREEEDHADAKDRTESVVGVRAVLNFSAGLDSRRDSMALAKESQASKLLAERHKRQVAAELTGEMASLKALHEQVHEAEENIDRAERYYRLTQAEYARGVKNSPDVLGASVKLFDMQNKRLEIIRDFQVAKSHVLSKLGR